MKVNRTQKDKYIGIFSPSEPITQSRIERLNKGTNELLMHNFKFKFSKNSLAQYYYCAGTIKERIEDIHELLADNEVSALLTSWGGKSCNQLISLINYELIQDQKKPILGFSDGCVLLNAITAITGLFTFHGPNVAGKLYETKHADLDILTNENYDRNLNLLGDVNLVEHRVLKAGSAQGRTFGGNLSTFSLGIVGTKYMPNFKEGGIFFWESASDRPQIVHQYLQFLRNAGIFDNLKGMVVGDFIVSEDSDYKKRDPFEMILEVCEGYNFPILYCPTFGHDGTLENPILPIGTLCELSTKESSLHLLENILL
jgi:muramoyltetrapeptide carboxypeptidase